MVNLGPQWRGVQRPRLHDAPPGYVPPRPSREVQRRQLRLDYILLRAGTVVAIGLVAAILVICLVEIAVHV